MATKKKPAPPEAAELRRREAVLETAALSVELSGEGGLNSKGQPKPLNRHQLSRVGRHLLINRPDLLQHPVMQTRLRAIVQRFVAANPPAPLGARAKARAVDFFMGGSKGLPLEEARHCVAETAGVSYTSVKKAHIRFGQHKA